MTTFVLVPGFFLGAWSWRSVVEVLRERHHDAYPLSLTGLGERAHLARPDTDLEVHVTDVVNLLRYEDLRDVVLVGHSYGGLITTAAADRVPDRIAELVYVDTGPMPDGFAQADFDPGAREANEALVAERGDGWRLPPPSWAELAAGVPEVDEAVVARLDERAVDQPWLTATSPVRLTGAWEKLPRRGILSTLTVAQVEQMPATVPAFKHMAGDAWRFDELPTWHWPMLSRPRDLAELLLR